MRCISCATYYGCPTCPRLNLLSILSRFISPLKPATFVAWIATGMASRLSFLGLHSPLGKRLAVQAVAEAGLQQM
jgi:hypothetical protein